MTGEGDRMDRVADAAGVLDALDRTRAARAVWDVVISELVDHTAAGEGDS